MEAKRIKNRRFYLKWWQRPKSIMKSTDAITRTNRGHDNMQIRPWWLQQLAKYDRLKKMKCAPKFERYFHFPDLPGHAHLFVV